MSTRQHMEGKLGADLSDVRIHSGASAARAAGHYGAVAYTLGSDVVFARGRYTPGSPSGDRLLAHELRHVLQQRGAAPASARPDVLAPDHPSEAEARGERPLTRVPRQVVQRQVGAAEKETEESEGGTLRERLPKLAALHRNLLLASLQPLMELKPVPGQAGAYGTVFQGRSVLLTQEQLDKLRTTLSWEFARTVSQARQTAESAKLSWLHHAKTQEEQPLTASFTLGVASIRYGYSAFAEMVREFPLHYRSALEHAAIAEEAFKAGDYATAADALAQAEAAARTAKQSEEAYLEGVLSSADAIVTGLEWTRNLSFIAVGIMATIVTGGVAAGAIGGTSTVFGVGTVGTVAAANTIAVVAPVAANLGEAGMRVNLGMSVDWTKVAIDTAFDIVMSRIPGGKLGPWISKGLYRPFMAVAPQAAKTTLARIGVAGFGRIVESVLMERLQTLVKTTIDESYAALTGKDVTAEQFVENLRRAVIARLLDPRQAFMAALMGAVMTGVDVKYRGSGALPGVDQPHKQLAEQAPVEKAPVEDVAVDTAELAKQAAEPPAETVEPPPEQLPVDAAPPPAAVDEVSILDKPPSDPKILDDLKTEVPLSEEMLKPKKLGERDPSVPVEPPKPRKPPTAEEIKLVDAMLKATQDANMKAIGDPAVGGDPALGNAVDKSTSTMPGGDTLKQWAQKSDPEMVKQLWLDYTRSRPPAEVTPDGFAGFVKARQSIERGGMGEFTEAAVRGPKEVIAQPPGEITERGIDMITHEPGGRTKLIDNKAVKTGKKVGKVTALEENLPQNLDAAMDWMKQFASQPDTPPSIAAEVLPRLAAAKADIDTFLKTNKKPLDSADVQKEFAKILDNHGIDRVVTTSGGGLDVGITKRLQAWFKLE